MTWQAAEAELFNDVLVHQDRELTAGALQPDGSYLLRVPYSREPELVMDILRYGADVEVLAPPALREAVTVQLRAATALYERHGAAMR